MDICKLFVKHIGYQFPTDNEGRTPFHDAAQFGQLEVCKYFIKNFKDKNPASDLTGHTPLHAVLDCKKDKYKIFKLIVDNVMDKNPNDFEGNTPLHYLAWRGDLKLFKYLYSKVKEKNPKDTNGRTLLHEAVDGGQLSTVKFICKVTKDKNPKDNGGYTPLHIAASKNHVDIYKYIMKFVKDKNPKDDDGYTPLHMAAMEKRMDVYKMILENVKEKNPKNNDGETPLDLAMDDFIEMLKEARQNPSTKNLQLENDLEEKGEKKKGLLSKFLNFFRK